MKILIVEDHPDYVRDLTRALATLGEVTSCLGKDGQSPTKENVVGMILMSDVILLDQHLGWGYAGHHLLRHCGGKVVIGISSDHRNAPVHFEFKHLLESSKKQRDALRRLVASAAKSYTNDLEKFNRELELVKEAGARNTKPSLLTDVEVAGLTGEYPERSERENKETMAKALTSQTYRGEIWAFVSKVPMSDASMAYFVRLAEQVSKSDRKISPEQACALWIEGQIRTRK